MCRFALIVMTVLLAQKAFAAEPKKPDFDVQEFQKQMESMQEAALPLKAKQLELLIRTQLRVLSEPESTAQVAKFYRGLYEGLVKEGFSKKEAMQMVLRMPFPQMPGAPVF